MKPRINDFRIARRKVTTYTGQYNTERRRQTTPEVDTYPFKKPDTGDPDLTFLSVRNKQQERVTESEQKHVMAFKS